MSNPQDPAKPVAAAPLPEKKADFSNVSSHVDSVPAAAPKADFSNVVGTIDGVVQAAPAAEGATHTVEKGDTLSAIAKKHYGKSSRWRAIFEANRDVLSDPDRIFPGQVLKLPALDD